LANFDFLHLAGNRQRNFEGRNLTNLQLDFDGSSSERCSLYRKIVIARRHTGDDGNSVLVGGG
jgi:hypothetical protein